MFSRLSKGPVQPEKIILTSYGWVGLRKDINCYIQPKENNSSIFYLLSLHIDANLIHKSFKIGSQLDSS
jgi:hypothetical protein